MLYADEFGREWSIPEWHGGGPPDGYLVDTGEPGGEYMSPEKVGEDSVYVVRVNDPATTYTPGQGIVWEDEP